MSPEWIAAVEWWDVIARETRWYWGLFELWWRGWWHYHGHMVDFVLTEILLLVIIYLLFLTGLSLTRRTELGRWLGNHDLVFAFVFTGALVSSWVSLFETEPWRYFTRLLILFTGMKAIVAMKHAHGGWVALHRRALHNLVGMVWTLRDAILGRSAQKDDERTGMELTPEEEAGPTQRSRPADAGRGLEHSDTFVDPKMDADDQERT